MQIITLDKSLHHVHYQDTQSYVSSQEKCMAHSVIYKKRNLTNFSRVYRARENFGGRKLYMQKLLVRKILANKLHMPNTLLKYL